MIDNGSLLNAMFDIVEREVSGQTTGVPPSTVSPSMMRNSGEALSLYGSVSYMDRRVSYSCVCGVQACTRAMTVQMTANCSYAKGMP